MLIIVYSKQYTVHLLHLIMNIVIHCKARLSDYDSVLIVF